MCEVLCDIVPLQPSSPRTPALQLIPQVLEACPGRSSGRRHARCKAKPNIGRVARAGGLEAGVCHEAPLARPAGVCVGEGPCPLAI